MIQRNETGCLVRPEDEDALSVALYKVLSDQGLRARLGSNARQAATRRHHPWKVLQQTLSTYHTVVRMHSGEDGLQGRSTSPAPTDFFRHLLDEITTTSVNGAIPKVGAVKRGALQGGVVEGDLRRPVPGARVHLHDPRWVNVCSLICDADGRFIFPDIQVGTYICFCSPPGYAPAAVSVVVKPRLVHIQVLHLTRNEPA